MDILAGLTRSDRKAAHNQSLRAARLSRAARARFSKLFGLGALGLGALAGTAMLLTEIRHNQLNLDQAAASRRSAQFTRPLPDGVFCEHKVFDNKTDYLIAETISRCIPKRDYLRPKSIGAK